MKVSKTNMGILGKFVKNSEGNWLYQTQERAELKIDICPFLTGPLSQWFPSPFHDPSLSLDFANAEQYMMLHKALTFGDQEIAHKIMATDSPSKAKALGRRVKNYDDWVWSNKRYNVVLAGNVMKFSQNDYLKDILLVTKDIVLVESNQHDKIWGAGLSAEDTRIFDPSKWLGQNLLGKVLMEVRSKLTIN